MLTSFHMLLPDNTAEINTTYGPGLVGVLPDGSKIIARRGSSEGSPTLEIETISGRRIKIRYEQ